MDLDFNTLWDEGSSFKVLSEHKKANVWLELGHFKREDECVPF
jgi:hypothetical protein